MKYLKYFENYESWGDESKDELIDQLGDTFIEEYYQEHHWREAEELIQLFPNQIFYHFDDDAFMDSWISGERDNFSVSDNEYEYEDYLLHKYNDTEISDEDEEKIINIFKEDNDEIDEDELKDMYLDDIIKEMDNNQRLSVIENVFSEDDFTDWVLDKRYGKKDAEDVVIDLYGRKWYEDRKIIEWLDNWVDDASFEKWYMDNEEYDHMRDTVEDDMKTDKKIQRKLLNMSSENAIKLYYMFEDMDDTSKTIADTYKFQQAYIEEWAKEDSDDPDAKEQAIGDLHKITQIHPDIAKEYRDYMFYVDVDKYNL